MFNILNAPITIFIRPKYTMVTYGRYVTFAHLCRVASYLRAFRGNAMGRNAEVRFSCRVKWSRNVTQWWWWNRREREKRRKNGRGKENTWKKRRKRKRKRGSKMRMHNKWNCSEKKETVITNPCRCVFSSVLSRVMEGRACKTIFLRKYGRQESKGVI